MTAKIIRSALGVLQDEPDNDQAWTDLRGALLFNPELPSSEASIEPGELGATELAQLLEAARQQHEMRREYDAVADLLEIEVALAKQHAPDAEADLVQALAQVQDDILHDDAGAVAAWKRRLELRPDDTNAEEAIDRAEAKKSKWTDLAQRYFTESKSAGDASFKSSLLVSAAEIAYRYGRPDLEAKIKKEADRAAADADEPPKSSIRGDARKNKKKKGAPPEQRRKDLFEKTVGLLRDALTLDPKNRRAVLLQERLLRDEERWDDLATALDTFATESTAKDEKVAALVRLARVYTKKLDAKEKAVGVYERVLDLSPGHPEATNALVTHFTEQTMWDHLVSLYEGQLSGGGVRAGQEGGVILQIAMVNWRMREKPDAAEPYFERLRKLEPTHPGMLGFFREWCLGHNEGARLAQILSDAQRAMPDGPERGKLAAEIAGLAEEGSNAQKAIEQWRNVLRQDPANVAARDALKRLYRETAAYNHLADLLRTELERVAPDDAAARLPVLRDIAQLYREHIKSDSALVTVLSQIIALDAADSTAVRELAGVYESLGRWRDLLTTQMRLAELEASPLMKAELYRAIARRWLDQFSNVQNAVEAYEKLREALPDDNEALSKLRELYTKRRAFRQLYDILDAEAKRADGVPRRALWMEMAKMASERLDRGADATRLFKQILGEDPTDATALDALEKQAERDKDYATVAEALERRADLTEDPAAKLTVLQKLGSVFADRLQDHAGALRIWRRVLELSPGHAKALRILRESYLAIGDYDGLTSLYAQSKDWEGLVEVISGAADRTTDVTQKIDLSFRQAALYEQELKAPERAFRAYERVLSVRPDDKRAAAALVPLYEGEEKWARLPSLYETLLANASANSDSEKRALYKKLAIVTGQKLSDKAAAFTYATRAFELAAGDPSALRDLEEWARASGDWEGFAKALESRAKDTAADYEERRSLRLKLADVAATHTGHIDDAIGAYRELILTNEEDEEAITALDRLLRTTPERHDDLRWLFRLRVRRAGPREGRITMLSEWALLEEEAFGSPAEAVALYREILGLDDRNVAALRALGRLLLAAGDAEGAANALQQERDLEEGGSRVAREIELARLYMGPLKKPLEALNATKRALELSPNDPAVIAVVEELLPMSETRTRAAVMLEESYGATGAWQKQAEVLNVLIATAASKADRLSLHGRLADVKEKLGDRVGAFDVVARAAQDNPAELELWDRLSVLANKTHRTQQFVEAIAVAVPERGETGLPPQVEIDLAERAATLYDEMLGEIDRATPYLERILARDPANERAFVRLKQILTTRERWQELEALYERVVTATPDPNRRADLLNEVAIIAEEITGDANKAIHYYERILELEPGHDQAIFALDKLYANAERWQNLADLLVRRLSLAGSTDTTSLPLKLRLGTLLMNRLNDPKAALNHLEEVVTADSSIREARELVEKCLTHPDLRQRAAIILEGVYAEREEMRDLVRVLEVRLEFVDADVERRELLRRIAELKDERLTDDKGAFETYGKLLPLSPSDLEARNRFLEIGTRLGRLDEAAEVILAAARNADSPQPRAELLSDVARIYEGSAAPERAEAIYRQAMDLAPEDPTIALPAVRSLERFYTERGKYRDLVEVLRVRVRLEESAEMRRELWAELGTIAEEKLSDDTAAIIAWRARLEDDPGDDRALVALDRLYERTGDYRSLVEILRARESGAASPEARKPLMVRAAQTLGDRIGDVPEAIVAYRSVLDDFGADRDILGALEKLYEKASLWPDLAETLEAELAIVAEGAANDPDRIALLTKLGDVRRRRLEDVSAALEAYRQALALGEGQKAPARAALEELLDDENARRESAEILRPIYEESREHAKLVRVLDIQVEHEATLEGRLDVYERLTSVTEGSLGDASKAFGYASRALKEAAGDSAVTTWITRAEKLTERTNAYADLASLFRDVVPDILDEEQQVALTLRIAEIAREKLSDATLAKEYYKKALEQRPEETRALVALERLYEEAGEHEQLIDILKRRAEIAETDAAKREILYKQAKICDQALGDRDRAVSVYEQILELGLDPPAIVALERLYSAQGRWGDLVALHERELVQGPPDNTTQARRADLHFALGRVHEKELGEVERAFDEYAEALREDANHASTVAALEHLMSQKVTAGRAAEMLEQVYLARMDWRKVMTAIEARLEGSDDPDERRTLLRRLAQLHEEQEENYKAALEVTAKLLAEDITDETTWAELERLARVANAEPRLAEIYAAELDKVTSDEPSTARIAYRTGELFEAQKESARALTFYRRAYAFSPEEEQNAFMAIDRLLEQGAKPAERVALYRDALEYRSEPEVRVLTLHAIAKVEEEELSDDEAAILTFRQVVEVDETDAPALDALARLYARRERFRDLAELHRRRAEQSALPEEEARWRLLLGRVLEEKLTETAGAIDELEIVIGLVPPQASDTGRAAVAALEAMVSSEDYRGRVVDLLAPIYEQADDWQKLVGVARHRLAMAATPGEQVAVLRDIAKLLEERGNDVEKAFDALKEAFVLDPDDGDTREELDRLAVTGERWDDLADAYEKGIAKIDGIGQRELLEALARLHDKRRDDPRKALDAWDRLFRLDESDSRPLDEMDQLATLLSDWPVLVRVLAKRAELTNDDEERASLWRRIGEARRDMLDDPQGSIDAYERALELEPDSAFTLDNIIALYEERNDAARLVDLYRRRVELCGEDDLELKHRLLLDAARCYEVGLGDRREAIVLLGQALATQPGDAEVMQRLEGLYQAEKMWPDLLDNLRAQADATPDPQGKAQITRRIGTLLASEEGDHEKALDAFREVLAIGYDDDAVKAVREIGEARDDHRLEAAAILEPVLRAAGKFDELRGIYELRLRAQSDPGDRAATLRSIALVSETSLSDLDGALAALLRAVADEPQDPSLHQEIERVASLRGTAGWERYADTLGERASSIFDAKITAELFFRLGTVAETRLSDLARAAEAYARAAEQGGDTLDVLTALERVHAGREDTRALVDVLERRIQIEPEETAQADLYHRLASLQIGALGDKVQGLATLRLALETAPSHDKSRAAVEQLLDDEAHDSVFDDAFDTLEGVYRTTSRGAELGKLYARRVPRAEGVRGRTRARLELARVLETEGADAPAAQRAVEAAVIEDPNDDSAISELERIADVTRNWPSAAEALAKALDQQERAAKEQSNRNLGSIPAGASGQLWARLGQWRRDKVEDPRGAELAYTRALDADPENIELVRALDELTRSPGRERDRIAVLRRLARLEGEPSTKRELSREAMNMAENVLADPRLAEAVLRELLAENESDAWAAEELTRLRHDAGDHAEVVALLLRRAESEGETATALRHRAADVARVQLGDRDKAIALYEEILEQDPTDDIAQHHLRALYEELGKYNELGKLLGVLIDNATSPEIRANLRLALARLQLEKFEAPRDSADTLRAILDEDPDNEAASEGLAGIFEKLEQHSELAELWTQRVQRARDRGDAAAEQERMLVLAEILETRVKDNAEALGVYETILERDPLHGGALSSVARLAEARGAWEKAAGALATMLGSLEGQSGEEVVGVALRLARAREELADEAGASEALKRALDADPKNADVRSRLAKLYEKGERWADLATLLVGDADILAETHPYDPPPFVEAAPMRGSIAPGALGASIAPPVSAPPEVLQQVNLLRRAAEIHLKQQKSPDEAIPLLERVTRLVPQDRELMLMLVDAFTQAKRARDAANVLERIISSFGNKRTKELSLYYHRLSKALVALGERDAALAQLEMAFKIDPGSIEVLRDLGVLALETGDLDRAQKTFRALLLQRLDAGSGISKGEVFYYLGEISMKQGDKAKAVQMLERAVENEPSLERAKAMLAELKA